MSTDYRALCARMADELDHYRQLLTDNRRETHALATEARAALAQPEPVAPDHAEICRWLSGQAHWGPHDPNIARVANLVQYALARYARPTVEPMPVAERPWEREGWCDAEGQCWMGDPGGAGFIPSWRLCRPGDAPSMTCSLPHHALPTPEAP
jgi:hypothetical protein